MGVKCSSSVSFRSLFMSSGSVFLSYFEGRLVERGRTVVRMCSFMASMLPGPVSVPSFLDGGQIARTLSKTHIFEGVVLRAAGIASACFNVHRVDSILDCVG